MMSTIPQRICPRTRLTMPAITRMTARIHNRNAMVLPSSVQAPGWGGALLGQVTEQVCGHASALFLVLLRHDVHRGLLGGRRGAVDAHVLADEVLLVVLA